MQPLDPSSWLKLGPIFGSNFSAVSPSLAYYQGSSTEHFFFWASARGIELGVAANFSEVVLQSADAPYLGPSASGWDSFSVEPSANPVPLSDGNLLMFYTGAELVPGEGGREGRLRIGVGAVVFEKKNPANVLYRTKDPVLEPDSDWQQCLSDEGVLQSQVVYITDCQAIDAKNNFRVMIQGCTSMIGGGKFEIDIIGWVNTNK